MNESSKWLRLMLLSFVANGLGPFGLKILTEKGLAAQFHFQYLVWWYAGGLAFGVSALLISRSRVQFRDLIMAFGIGAASFGGQLFSAMALEQQVPGYIVFPVTTGGNLILVAAGGVFLFRERIGIYGILGIVTGIASLLLLSLR